MASRPIRTFTVLPHLPARLQPLQTLAHNMWWCWNHEAVSLLRRVDEDLFDAVENSPVKLLGAIDQTRLEELLRGDGVAGRSLRDEALGDEHCRRGAALLDAVAIVVDVDEDGDRGEQGCATRENQRPAPG